MSSIFFEVAISLVFFTVIMTIIFIIQTRPKPNKDSDDDDDGGIPANFPPDFDLPPGVCLPNDPKRHKILDKEEIPA